jgi:hypothetical protein
MRIEGSGGPVTITAVPAVATGTPLNGEKLILQGSSDTNTVTLNDGTGLHVHGTQVLRNHDMIELVYHTEESEWQELSRNNPTTDKSFAFSSPAGTSGIFYAGGFYEFFSGNDDFSPGATSFGTASTAKAAHFFVVLGAITDDELTIRVTGTSITDAGVRTTSDTQDIVIPISTAADTYFETSKKWLGQISIQVQSGTAKDCNYGFCKYWDDRNTNFILSAIEATWLAGATDANIDLGIIHHQATGWTYNVGSTPTPPTAVTSMSADHSTDVQLVNNEHGAWKHTGLSEPIAGGDGEGTIIQITTSANKAFEQGNFIISIIPA